MMARKSLRPQLNQIRAWVRQGRTDAWVAHQLEVTVQEIEQFKRQNDLMGGEEAGGEGVPVLDYPDEIDLRAEDDALIAAELEEAARVEAEEKARAEAQAAERRASERTTRTGTGMETGRGRGTEMEMEMGIGMGMGTERAVPGPAAAAAAEAEDVARPRAPRRRLRAPLTTARRATGCGWTRPCRTIRCTPSTGPDTDPLRSSSRRTR